VKGWGGEGRSGGVGGEMTQTLYAHMNKREKKKRKCLERSSEDGHTKVTENSKSEDSPRPSLHSNFMYLYCI
jgi:hypothetical protein